MRTFLLTLLCLSLGVMLGAQGVPAPAHPTSPTHPGIQNGNTPAAKQPAPQQRPIERPDKNVLISCVHMTAVGLGNVLAEVKNDDARETVCRNFVKDNRFFGDKSGYLTIIDDRGKIVADGSQPDMKTPGTMGKASGPDPMLQKITDSVKGDGFSKVSVPNPQTGKDMVKLLYSEKIPGSRYIVFAGMVTE